ncbi:hypothetical protein AF332_02605 [Sporosarcina globispora]|uniref:Uncharacterized protein n=1 Tax=Sporosarcina globispora TaxID=1459 RepID=A0A0M0G8R2_SPOGL|nr:hypothetical protein AF332_02605 [Sporosarcina globispora]
MGSKELYRITHQKAKKYTEKRKRLDHPRYLEVAGAGARQFIKFKDINFGISKQKARLSSGLFINVIT